MMNHRQLPYHLSNTVVGYLNLLTLLASIPVIGATPATTCQSALQGPLLAVGFVAFLVSLPSFIGAHYHVSWALWLYLAALLLVLALLGATAFGLAVTAGGGGTQVMGRPYREYHTRDYSACLQKHVADEKYWRPAPACVASSRACREVAGWTPEHYMRRDLTPVQSGCCKPRAANSSHRCVVLQVHTAVIMYNYYHRKMCPRLAFADAKRFFMCASLSVGEDLFLYLRIVHACENNSRDDVSLSVTDREGIQACEIAKELDATKDYPDIEMWPIGKVAVVLLDLTKKKCLIEYGADTKGVWSIIEKEYDAAAGISHSTNQPAGQELTNRTISGALDGPLMLQQLAISEVQRRTCMDGSDLIVLDEDLAYSLSKERTTTKLFILEYKKTTKGKLVEMPLEELICSMTGPVFVNDPFPKTTSVVEYYHILPYKEILQELLHKKWHVVPQHGLHSMIDEKLEEQDENSMPKMRKQIAKVSTPKKNKRAIKATGLATKSINTKATIGVIGGPVILQSVDKYKTQNDNMHQDVSPPMVPCADPVIENSALEPQNMEMTENSGGITENNNDQMYDLLRSIQKIRDEILHKECILQERSIQCDMDIQTILNEGKMTPKMLSIGDKYKGTCSNVMDVANSSGSGDGGQTMSTKRKTLKEALHIRNKCQELDGICNVCEWILPRYTTLPSVADGMFCASVHLRCPDFDMSIVGDPCPTPREARCSAAANMMVELHKKAKE
ncbi:hypothetical protein ACQ4PT_024169 [Festuca glaucescens]